MRYYVSIEKNIEVFELYKPLWVSYGINGIRADTMAEGIEKAIEIEKSKADELYFIDIVADDMDYMPQLKILSEETNAPILIATSNYDDNERHEALHKGADHYGKYCETTEQNIEAVIAFVSSIDRRREKQNPQPQVMIYKNLLVSVEYTQVFAKNTEINLTRKEFDILCYLMKNQGNILTYAKILGEVWGVDNATPEILRTHMKRMRKKIVKVLPYYESIIENVHGFGYRFAY